MVGLLCNWFDDWGRTIKNGLGAGWLVTLIVIFSVIALWLLQNILRASVNKKKFEFKWGQFILLVIFVLFIVWFSILL